MGGNWHEGAGAPDPADRDRLLARAVSATTSGILITAADLPDNPIIYANDSFCRITGYAPGEILGRNCRFLQGPGTDPGTVARIRAAVTEGRGVRERIVNHRKDGSRLCFDLVISPVHDAAGRLRFFVGVQNDVTRQVEAEEALRAGEARLRRAERLEALGRLTSGVAHEFNNALTPILSLTELAVRDVPAGELREDLEVVLRAARAARGVVQRLLAFSRPEPGEMRAVPFAEVVADATRLLRPGLPEGVRLSCPEPAGEFPVLGDRGQLLQLVINLLGNARDAVGPGPGAITLDLAPAELDGLGAEALGLRPGRHVRLDVADTGPGMDAATQEHIFEPFFTTKGPGEGTGLGLPVAHGLVTGHKGAIAVRSAPGKGTVFTVHLPLAAGATDGPEGQSRGEEPRGKETGTADGAHSGDRR